MKEVKELNVIFEKLVDGKWIPSSGPDDYGDGSIRRLIVDKYWDKIAWDGITIQSVSEEEDARRFKASIKEAKLPLHQEQALFRNLGYDFDENEKCECFRCLDGKE